MNNLKKHFLVTGASSGIGRAVAVQLAKRDGYIHGVARDETELAALKEEIGSDNCSTYVIDLRDQEKIHALVADILKITPSLAWIIQSAGYIDPNESDGTDSESIRKTFETNICAPILLTILTRDHIDENGGIVYISSTAGIWGSATFPVYSASKAAVNVYAQSLARQWSNSQRTSIALCPGATNTPMRERARGDADQHQSPDIVARVVQKIIHAESSYKNGDIVIVRDGVDSLHQSLQSVAKDGWFCYHRLPWVR